MRFLYILQLSRNSRSIVSLQVSKKSIHIRSTRNRRYFTETLVLHFHKNIADPDYIKVEPNLFGPYTQPNLEKINTQPSLGVSPPQGRTLKRARDSPENTTNPSKCPVVTLTNLKLRPSWMNQETFTPVITTKKNTNQTPNKTNNHDEQESD